MKKVIVWIGIFMGITGMVWGEFSSAAGSLNVQPDMLFTPLNYFATSIVHIIVAIFAFRLCIVFKGDKKLKFFFGAVGIDSLCIVCHTIYWGYAKLQDACGNKELYAFLSNPFNFAGAQGFESIGGLILLIGFWTLMFSENKGG